MARGPKTAAGKAKSMQNLVPFAEKKEVSMHGCYEISLLQPQTRLVMETLQGILSGDTSSFILPCDKITVGLLAVCLRRIQQCEAFLDKVGSLTNQKGELRGATTLLIQLLKQARGFCDALGLTPLARSRMGLSTARTFSLAEELAKLGGFPDDDDSDDSGSKTVEEESD